MELRFETIRFLPAQDGVRGLLLKFFTFTIPHKALNDIGRYTVTDGTLTIDCSEKKRERVLSLIKKSMDETLTCTVTNNPATYIDQASNVPLVGALEFGVIDRGTNLIEVRPASGCNLACTYCSVSEGRHGPKKRDFVIEKDYLLQAFDTVAKQKTHPIEVFIETQGEPLLYWDLPALIKDLKARGDVAQVTMVTNGTFLTEERVQALADAGLDRINWSINSLQQARAENIAGAPYNVTHIKEMIHTAKDYVDVLLCPVIMQGVNDDELEDFVHFAKTVRSQEPVIGFQSFLYYKGGRNPVEEVPLTAFQERLRALEERTNTRLLVSTTDFSIVDDTSLEKPMKKRDLIEVERLFPGRTKNETFCAARGRLVKVLGRTPDKQRFTVQIIRDKHNIFLGKTA